MDLSAVILAGGQSRRMGRDKAFVEFSGTPMLHSSLARLRTLAIPEIFISGRPDCDYSALRCPVLLDETPGLGPLAGIERALFHATAPLVLVMAVDLPRMTTEFLRGLIEACAPLTGVIPSINDVFEPLAAVYPKRAHPLAAAALASGHYAVSGFASACLQNGALRVLPVAPEDAACFVNCNTPADLGH